MTQKPAYTSDQIIAAAMAMLARGIAPTRTGLWRELGARGQPQTTWKIWCDHHEKRVQPHILAGLPAQQKSPEMTEVIEAHHLSLAAVIDRARKEVAAPLQHKIAVLEEMIARQQAENEDLSDLVTAMSEALAERDTRIDGLNAGKGKPQLILP
jgi:hypothetical protein